MMVAFKIEARNMSKTYSSGGQSTEALRDLTIQVRSGEFASLVGASGCGKTTLLRILDGLDAPTSGSVLIDGERASKVGTKRAFVFQNDSLFPWRSVVRNTLLGPEIQGRQSKKVSQIASRLLALVGLGGFHSRYPYELSGGMRQRVNLARALTVEPDILLMDEPFAALDAQTREIMQGELLRIWAETRKTVLLVTHQIDEAVLLSDVIFVLTVRPGRLKEEIRIDLPRPRTLAVKRTAEFVAYVDRVWKLIEDEVRESMEAELIASEPGL